MEIILSDVWQLLFGSTKSPVNLHFKELKDNWENLQRTASFKTLQIDNTRWPLLNTLLQSSVELLQKILKSNNFLRDDYKEMAELTLLLLSKHSKEMLTKVCKKPGAISNARWMQKVIYTFKMFIFQNQLQYNLSTKQFLERFVQFACLLYVPIWFKCPSAANAPPNDLEFYKDLCRYELFFI